MATQIMSIIDCSDYEQLDFLMDKCGIVRSEVYNRLGSLQGWGKHWKNIGKIFREKLTPEMLGLPSKIFESSSLDCFKAISAQQAASISFLIKDIYKRTADNEERKRLINLLYTEPTKDNWLHRRFRKQYLRRHSYLRNQVVYHKQAYKCTRISRYKIKIQVQGIERGKPITLIAKSNKVPTGQIRVIKNNRRYELHTAFKKKITPKPKQYPRVIGVVSMSYLCFEIWKIITNLCNSRFSVPQ